jgi:RND family efflux transporter MFP subunit
MTMNYERKVGTMDMATSKDQTAYATDSGRRRSRAMIVGALILIALVLVGVWYAFSGGDGAEATKASATKAAGAKAGAVATTGSEPSVTVIIPGRQQIDNVVTATGTIAARREMPVGVAGEGGQVLRVLVEPGQWVGAGQVLAVVDRAVQSQQLGALAAQIRVAQADANLAQAELDRAKALIERGFISKADMDRKTATRDAAAARVRVAQAQLGESQARTGRLDIRAPAAGLVLTRQVEPGQVVGAGSGVLFRLARGGEMELQARVSEADMQTISTGVRASVNPVGTALNIAGEVWQLSPVIDPQTRQGTVRIATGYNAALRPGGFATAKIIRGSAMAPLLPESAILSDAGVSYVYIVGADNKIERRDVTVGNVSEAGVGIMAGLTGQERVVLSAGGFLNAGEKVRPTLAKVAK